jgi:type II secretion system protein N
LLLTIAYLLLTGLFVALRFPVDRLNARVAALASRAIGAEVSIGELELHLVALLPELSARNVECTWPASARLHLDRVRVRPAWSLSWLRGDPSLALSLRREAGRIRGIARLGETPGFRGTVTDLDLAQLPTTRLGSGGIALDGRLEGEFDVRSSEQGPEGRIVVRAADGSLSLPILPMGVPFETLETALALGGDPLLTVHSLALEGPLVALTGSGTVERAPTAALAPLLLAARLEIREPALREMFTNSGVDLGPDGVAELSVRGTVSAPVLTSADRAGAGLRGAATNPRLPRRTGNPRSDAR